MAMYSQIGRAVGTLAVPGTLCRLHANATDVIAENRSDGLEQH